MGDADGDGWPDLLLGASGDGAGGEEAGAAYLVPGGELAGTLAVAEIGGKIPGTAPGWEAGASVAGPGDIDGDGRPDLLIGAPGYDAYGSASGAAFLLLTGDL